IQLYVSAAARCWERSKPAPRKSNLSKGPRMIEAHAMRKYHFLISFFVVLLDRIAKLTVERNISLHESISIIPGFFRLTHVQNRGAAFGLFADSPSEWKIAVLVLFSLVALVIVSVLLCYNGDSMTMIGVDFDLTCGGGLGGL